MWFGDIYRARDELWHISLAAVAFESFPFNLPIFYGELLKSYHFLFDLILFSLKSFGLDIFFSNFVLLPVVWFALYTVVSIILAKKITNSIPFIFFFLFFQYFAGSFGYFFPIYHSGTVLGGPGINYQSITYITNMPLAFSLVTFIAILAVSLKSKFNRKDYLVISLLLFLTWGFKFYGGVAAILFLFSTLFINTIKKELNFTKSATLLVSITLISTVAIMIFYNPFDSIKTGSIFMLSPFALAHSIIEEKDRFYLPSLVDARYYLYSTNVFGPRLLAIELFSTFLFFIFTNGTRIIGLIFILLSKKSKTDFSLLLTFFTTFLISMLFIQRGDWFNPMQFYVYGMIVLNIYTAKALYLLFEKRTFLKTLLIVFILILTVPHTIDTVYRYDSYLLPFSRPSVYDKFPSVYIPSEELQALKFLKAQPEGIVYSLPIGATLIHDTAYISAISEKQSYLANTHQLELLGITYKERLDSLKRVDNFYLPVTYYYLVKNSPLYNQAVTSLINSNYQPLFENNSVIMFKRI